MGSVVQLVQLISDAVVSDLSTGGQLSLSLLPDGSAGKILLGKQHDYEHTDAPRIIFTPMGSEFGPRDIAAPVPQRPMTERVIGTDSTTFQVRCWGRGVNDAYGSTSPDADYDATRSLYQSILSMVHITCSGCYEFGKGTWTDDAKNIRRGREFVFELTLATPIYARSPLANLASPVPAANPPSNYVTPGTTKGETVTIVDPTGSPTGSVTIT